MNHQIKIVLTSFFYLVVFNSFSQTHNTSNSIGSWGVGYPPHEEGYIEGTRYLHDDFRNGNVYYAGKTQPIQLPLRLNLHNDEFEYMEKDSVFAFEEPNRIDKVILEDEVYIYIDKSIDMDIYGFVKISDTEFPCILTKMRIAFLKKVISRSPTVESAPDRFVRIDDRNYLMKSETEFLSASSVKILISLLDHSQELTEFAKEEKIYGRSQSGNEMAKILDYYHTLGNDL